MTGDITYYAHWTVNTYTVSFNGNGGAVSEASRSRTYEAQVGTLPTATRTGYTFVGWYTAADGGTRVTEATVVTGDTTYHAHWTGDTRTVTFDANGGSCSTSTKDYVFGEQGTLPIATRPEYTFRGWYTAPEGGDLVTTTTAFASNMVLHAHWWFGTPTPGYTWGYEVVDGRAVITNCTPAPSGRVEIPASLDGYPVSKLGDVLFCKNEGNTSFIVPAGIESIGLECFDYADNQAHSGRHVYLPETISQLSWNSFRYFNGGTVHLTVKPNHKNIAWAFNNFYGNLDVVALAGVPVGMIRYGFQYHWDSRAPGYDNGNTTFRCKRAYYDEWRSFFGKDAEFLGYIDDDYSYGTPIPVTFDVMEGEPPVGRICRQGLPYGELPTPTRPDYTFAGWFMSATGGTQVTRSTIVSLSGAHTLYAHWTERMPADQTLLFMAAGGTRTTHSFSLGAEALHFDRTTIPSWITGLTLQQNVEGVNGSIVNTIGLIGVESWDSFGPSSTCTLDVTVAANSGAARNWTFAITRDDGCVAWSLEVKQAGFGESCTVTFDANGGTVTEPSRTYAENAEIGEIPAPSRSGSLFWGWFTAPNGGERVTAATQVEGDMTCYARWISSSVAAGERPYMVIDMSDPAAYGVSYLDAAPEAGWPDEYKTSKMVLRRIELGGVTAFIGVFECTQRQWELVVGTRPSYFNNTATHAMYPVENVSYNDIRGSVEGARYPVSDAVDADSFMGIMRRRTGLPVDLPTSDQWILACRAGGDRDVKTGRGHFAPNKSTTVVGSYAANEWGIYDMFGNVSEWALDWSREAGKRDTFGGSWNRYGFMCDATKNAQDERQLPDFAFNELGFRVVVRPSILYAVSFDANGGTCETSERVCEKGTVIGTLPTPTRTGYTFDGWFTSASGGTQVSAATVVSADVTYYAHWTVKSFTVTFDANGGAASETKRTLSYNAALGTLPAATRTGYTLAGWYTAKSGGTKIASTTKVTADATYYARWTANAYTVSFDANGGAGSMDPQAFTYGTASALAELGFAKTGYTFAGWTTNALAEVVYEGGAAVSNLTAAASGGVTLYALWTANRYTVSFNANGGTGTMAPQAFAYDAPQTLRANAFTRTGYAFAGWALSATGAKAHGDGASVTNLTDEADGTVTLYALWTANSYTVTFDANGGSCATASTTVTNGSTYGTLPKPTRSGYTFAGWFTAASGGTQVTASTPVSLSGVQTLYAHWTADLAGEYVWTGAQDAYWTNAANWTVGGVVAANPPGWVLAKTAGGVLTTNGTPADVAVFGACASGRTTIDLDGQWKIDSVVFTNEAPAYTLGTSTAKAQFLKLGLKAKIAVAEAVTVDQTIQVLSSTYDVAYKSATSTYTVSLYNNSLTAKLIYNRVDRYEGNGVPYYYLYGVGTIHQNGPWSFDRCSGFQLHLTGRFVLGDTSSNAGSRVYTYNSQATAELAGNPRIIELPAGSYMNTTGGSWSDKIITAYDNTRIVGEGTILARNHWNSTKFLPELGGNFSVAGGKVLEVDTAIVPTSGGVTGVFPGSIGLFGTGTLLLHGTNTCTGAVRFHDAATLAVTRIGAAGCAAAESCLGTGSEIRFYQNGTLRYVGDTPDGTDRSFTTTNSTSALALTFANGGKGVFTLNSHQKMLLPTTLGATLRLNAETAPIVFGGSFEAGQTWKMEVAGTKGTSFAVDPGMDVPVTVLAGGRLDVSAQNHLPSALDFAGAATIAVAEDFDLVLSAIPPAPQDGASIDFVVPVGSSVTFAGRPNLRLGTVTLNGAPAQTDADGKLVPQSGSDAPVDSGVVPHDWILAFFPGTTDFVAKTRETAANGRLTVEDCYVAGLDPRDVAAEFQAQVSVVDGRVYVSWTPNLNTESVQRIYTIYGRTDLDVGDWETPIKRWHRFFKVAVAMPTGADGEETAVAGEGFVPEGLGGVQLWENGPYWAECNVGATKPEEYGYYFWWGDTVGYKRNASDDGWESVKNGASFSFSAGNCLTYDKSTTELQSEGYIDATGNLVAKYDAATAHLGAPWRMPTDAEMSALVSNCTTTWTTHNGVYGRLVTGKGAFSTKSIFLPASSSGSGSSLGRPGVYGYYWSSTPYSEDPVIAWRLSFYSNYIDRSTSRSRDYGLPVRPVRGFAK